MLANNCRGKARYFKVRPAHEARNSSVSSTKCSLNFLFLSGERSVLGIHFHREPVFPASPVHFDLPHLNVLMEIQFLLSDSLSKQR